mmetsp:Transcript_18212/g.68894  ORF Transcript_18212/g.68894 Transcript_18212/m.68894 type:complete len:355 (+) Transcript_18212:291-1355(+)
MPTGTTPALGVTQPVKQRSSRSVSARTGTGLRPLAKTESWPRPLQRLRDGQGARSLAAVRGRSLPFLAHPLASGAYTHSRSVWAWRGLPGPSSAGSAPWRALWLMAASNDARCSVDGGRAPLDAGVTRAVSEPGAGDFLPGRALDAVPLCLTSCGFETALVHGDTPSSERAPWESVASESALEGSSPSECTCPLAALAPGAGASTPRARLPPVAAPCALHLAAPLLGGLGGCVEAPGQAPGARAPLAPSPPLPDDASGGSAPLSDPESVVGAAAPLRTAVLAGRAGLALEVTPRALSSSGAVLASRGDVTSAPMVAVIHLRYVARLKRPIACALPVKMRLYSDTWASATAVTTA